MSKCVEYDDIGHIGTLLRWLLPGGALLADQRLVDVRNDSCNQTSSVMLDK